jgi:hypothetical protein
MLVQHLCSDLCILHFLTIMSIVWFYLAFDLNRNLLGKHGAFKVNLRTLDLLSSAGKVSGPRL